MVILLLVVVILIGCGVPLTREGGRVRRINPESKTECRYLGVVEADEDNPFDPAEGQRDAMNSIRNKVATRGGNAFVISNGARYGSKTIIQADAYWCP